MGVIHADGFIRPSLFTCLELILAAAANAVGKRVRRVHRFELTLSLPDTPLPFPGGGGGGGFSPEGVTSLQMRAILHGSVIRRGLLVRQFPAPRDDTVEDSGGGGRGRHFSIIHVRPFINSSLKTANISHFACALFFSRRPSVPGGL